MSISFLEMENLCKKLSVKLFHQTKFEQLATQLKTFYKVQDKFLLHEKGKLAISPDYSLNLHWDDTKDSGTLCLTYKVKFNLLSIGNQAVAYYVKEHNATAWDSLCKLFPT